MICVQSNDSLLIDDLSMNKYMDVYGVFHRMGVSIEWGYPKSPWVSILSHGLVTWMIGGTPFLGNTHMFPE